MRFPVRELSRLLMVAMFGAGLTASHIATVLSATATNIEAHVDCPDECDCCKPDCAISSDCAACHGPGSPYLHEPEKRATISAPAVFSLSHADPVIGSTLDPPLPPPRLA